MSHSPSKIERASYGMSSRSDSTPSPPVGPAIYASAFGATVVIVKPASTKDRTAA
jgi:hypothetical protein